MASNPRIEDLRKRLEKEPGSRLFAQLAEELRKAGELDEAISVARDGLARHANYPSARMTLGRALFDLGDLRAARTELEAVVGAAPDNILACRLLGEALEGLGFREEAAARYRTVLALAPGDRGVGERLAALALAATAGPLAAPSAEPVRELSEVPPAASTPSAVDAPIPLVAVDEDDFELERPSETTARLMAVEAPPARPFERADWDPSAGARDTTAEARATVAGGFGDGRDDLVFDFETPGGEAAPTVPFVSNLPAAAGERPSPPAEEAPEPAEPPPSPDAVPALSSPTLAELYFSQGVPEKAVAVYRQILEREPWNQRVRTRLDEIEARLGAAAARVLADAAEKEDRPPATRREALERTIVRLEAFLDAVREGRATWPVSPTP